MQWWHWLVLGLILVALELASSGGFYVIFFGLAALVIAGLHLVGYAPSLWWQLLLFSVLSVGALVAFRNPLIHLLKLDQGAPDVDTLVGERAVPLEDIAPGEVGRAELRGTAWSARNGDSTTLVRGTRCVVAAVDRLEIILKREGAIR